MKTSHSTSWRLSLLKGTKAFLNACLLSFVLSVLLAVSNLAASTSIALLIG